MIVKAQCALNDAVLHAVRLDKWRHAAPVAVVEDDVFALRFLGRDQCFRTLLRHADHTGEKLFRVLCTDGMAVRILLFRAGIGAGLRNGKTEEDLPGSRIQLLAFINGSLVRNIGASEDCVPHILCQLLRCLRRSGLCLFDRSCRGLRSRGLFLCGLCSGGLRLRGLRRSRCRGCRCRLCLGRRGSRLRRFLTAPRHHACRQHRCRRTCHDPPDNLSFDSFFHNDPSRVK